MNSKRSSYRGFGIYLLLILAIIGIWYWMDGNTSTNSYTRAQFETAVADGNVAQLKIVPNRGEVPTGNVYITFKDSSTQVLAVNDVNDIEDYLRDQQFTSYTVENPPEQSWYRDDTSVSDYFCGDVHFLHDYDQSGGCQFRRRR